MDAATKRRRAEAVRRGVTRELAAFGFARTKPTFWTRPEGHWVGFVHLHLFSFAPTFRVHLGVRVLNDTFPVVALNGTASFDGWYGKNRDYVFEYTEDRASCDRCSQHVGRFVREVGVPWFTGLNHDVLLGDAPDSPLSDSERERLRLALAGHAEASAVALSKSILGIASELPEAEG